MNAKEILMQVFDEEGINSSDFWEKHCARYHPKGFKSDSVCKYIDDKGDRRIIFCLYGP